MEPVNVYEAKTDFSHLLRLIESGSESSITISRAGKPIAELIPFRSKARHRFGVAKGEVLYLGDFDEANEEIAALFQAAQETTL